MSHPDAPEDGDFASFLDGRQRRAGGAREGLGDRVPPAEPARQRIEDVLVHGEEPTAELLEALSALESAPELSDEELARQALEAPGADGDTSTPE